VIFNAAEISGSLKDRNLYGITIAILLLVFNLQNIAAGILGGTSWKCVGGFHERKIKIKLGDFKRSTSSSYLSSLQKGIQWTIFLIRIFSVYLILSSFASTGCSKEGDTQALLSCSGFLLSGHGFRMREAKFLDPNIVSLVKMSEDPRVLRRAWGDRNQACWFFAIPTSKHNA